MTEQHDKKPLREIVIPAQREDISEKAMPVKPIPSNLTDPQPISKPVSATVQADTSSNSGTANSTQGSDTNSNS